VRRVTNILIVLLVVAALPLRGYAGALMQYCGDHHGGDAGGHAHSHETAEHEDAGHGHGKSHDEDSSSHSASVCSLCTSCCLGATLAADSPRPVAMLALGTVLIPFHAGHVAGFVPEHLERPPLAL
jgi:hypothetical protein